MNANARPGQVNRTFSLFFSVEIICYANQFPFMRSLCSARRCDLLLNYTLEYKKVSLVIIGRRWCVAMTNDTGATNEAPHRTLSNLFPGELSLCSHVTKTSALYPDVLATLLTNQKAGGWIHKLWNYYIISELFRVFMRL